MLKGIKSNKLLNILFSFHTILFLAFISVLTLMLVTVPPFFVDMFIAFSIASSVFLFFMAIYIKRPLDFSILPFFLLVVTLFRLSLNVASTRLILLHGGEHGSHAAGEIIANFGKFVIGNNYLVGLVIFLILAVINIIVITKGAGRVAEVAARFSLDALTGKQLSIDSELSAGFITEEEAKRNRRELTQESDFYGAMDGASKFIKGDAFVTLFIVFINIIGGLGIGILQSSMSFSETVQTFVLLTIGDGLVSQIPALIISTATGIIITRTNSQRMSLLDQMNSQINSHSNVLIGSAMLMLCLAIIPSLPAIPFLLVGFIMLGAYFISRKKASKEVDQKMHEDGKNELKSEESPEPSIDDLLSVDLLRLELGYNLMHMLDGDKKEEFLYNIEKNRCEFATELGVLLPTLNIKDNPELKRNEYSLLLSGAVIGRSELYSNSILLCNLKDKKKSLSQESIVGYFPDLDGAWIMKDAEVKSEGFRVLSDQFSIINEHIKVLLNKHLHELLGREELKILLDNLERRHPKLVHDSLQEPNSFSIILKVLKNLLMERIPIKDMRSILEVIVDEMAASKDIMYLTECVRKKKNKLICSNLIDGKDELSVLTLDPDIEEFILDIINGSKIQGVGINDSEDLLKGLIASINIKFSNMKSNDCKPIIVCSPKIRYQLKRMTLPFDSDLVVLSHSEIDPSIRLKAIGIVGLQNNAS